MQAGELKSDLLPEKLPDKEGLANASPTINGYQLGLIRLLSFEKYFSFSVPADEFLQTNLYSAKSGKSSEIWPNIDCG